MWSNIGLIHVPGVCSCSMLGEFGGLRVRAGDSYFASSSHVVKFALFLHRFSSTLTLFSQLIDEANLLPLI